jgi:hypothetical protein
VILFVASVPWYGVYIFVITSTRPLPHTVLAWQTGITHTTRLRKNTHMNQQEKQMEEFYETMMQKVSKMNKQEFLNLVASYQDPGK